MKGSGAPRPAPGTARGELPAREPVVASQVEIHDKYQFDLKITYPLVCEPGDVEPEINYTVDIFLFVPKNFRVSPRTYPASRLLEDIQAYLRLDAPDLTIDELVDPASGRSPLWWLDRALAARVEGVEPPKVAAIVEQTRVLGCALVGIIRDREQECRRSHAAAEVFAPLERALREFRELKRRYEYHEVDVGTTVLRELRLADEWISLTLEEALAHAAQDGRLEQDDLEAVTDLARRELAYRRGRGYPSVTSDSKRDDEYFVYRRGQLKKHVQQVLFLDVRAEAVGSSLVGQIVAAVGAALAATWWFFAQTSASGGSSTFVLFLVAVVAYILKDRIKEVTRNELSNRLRRHLPDQTSTVQGGHVYGASFRGSCREQVRYVPASELPPDVVVARDLSHVVDLGDDPAEEVLHYRKAVTFKGELLERGDVARAQVRDIVRLGIRDFTEHLDDPKRVVTFFDDATGRFVSRRLPKIYHLNLVLRYRSHSGTSQLGDVSFERVRAIVNRKGIVRVDIVLPRTRAADLPKRLEEVP